MEYAPDWLANVMEPEGFLNYHAFWDQYKHNHKAHGAYSMASLGASPEMVKDYFNRNNSTIIKKIEGNRYDSYVTREKDTVQSDDIDDYKGAHAGLYHIIDYFIDEFETKYGRDRNKMIADLLPKLIDGPLLGTFHGTIHVAYGYCAKSDTAVIEGLSLFWNEYSSNFPKDPKQCNDLSAFGKGKTDMLDILRKIRNDKQLIEDCRPLYKDALDNRIEDFIKMADSLKLPHWFDASKQDMNQVVKVIDWILDLSAYAFVRFDIVNHFFLLHGITAMWALRTIIHFLDFKTALVGVRGHLIAFLAVYATSEAPALTRKPSDFWDGDVVDQTTWDNLIRDCFSKPRETHCYKVVQCCYQMWKIYPKSPFARDYIASCRILMDNTYFFPKPMPLPMPESEPSYKFYYLNLRGRGETIRMLFALGGRTFEDVRLGFPEWFKVKPNIKPMGQLPILQLDDTMYFQSNAMARFLAKKFGYYGKTEEEGLQADRLVESLDDLFFPLLKFFGTQDEAVKYQIKRDFKASCRKTLGKIDYFLRDNRGGDGWFVGDSITYADVYFYNFIDIITFGIGIDLDLTTFPKLKTLIRRVERHPKIAQHISKRPI